MSDTELAEQFNMPVEAIANRLADIHAQLPANRSKCVYPGLDDKALTSWNVLMLTTFAEAARYLDRSDYLAAARRNAVFLLDHRPVNGQLLRSW